MIHSRIIRASFSHSLTDLIVFLARVFGESGDEGSLLVDVAEQPVDDVVKPVGDSEVQRGFEDHVRDLKLHLSLEQRLRIVAGI